MDLVNTTHEMQLTGCSCGIPCGVICTAACAGVCGASWLVGLVVASMASAAGGTTVALGVAQIC